MTDEKALREKLEQLFAEARARMGIRVTDSKTLNRRDFTAVESVALDLLREKEQRETPCVWTLDGVGEGWYLGCDPREWQQSRGNFCSGCGHPVQVKQNEEK